MPRCGIFVLNDVPQPALLTRTESSASKAILNVVCRPKPDNMGVRREDISLTATKHDA